MKVSRTVSILGLSVLFTFFYQTGFCQLKKTERGIASFYSDVFNGKKTANGEFFSQNAFTAAHPTLPFNTKVRVTNLSNLKQVVVRINDRGPFISKRIIDLSKAAANALGYVYAGLAMVKIEVINGKEIKTTLAKNTAIVEVKSDSLIHHPKSTETKKTADTVSRKIGVQLGSFGSRQNWDNFISKANLEEQKLICQEVEIQGKRWYRAVYTGFGSVDSAMMFKKNHAKKFPGCFVVYF